MDLEQVMSLPPEQALDELSWESIEYLFKPVTLLELLVANNSDSTKMYITGAPIDPDQKSYILKSIDSLSEKQEYFKELKVLKDKKNIADLAEGISNFLVKNRQWFDSTNRLQKKKI